MKTTEQNAAGGSRSEHVLGPRSSGWNTGRARHDLSTLRGCQTRVRPRKNLLVSYTWKSSRGPSRARYQNGIPPPPAGTGRDCVPAATSTSLLSRRLPRRRGSLFLSHPATVQWSRPPLCCRCVPAVSKGRAFLAPAVRRGCDVWQRSAARRQPADQTSSHVHVVLAAFTTIPVRYVRGGRVDRVRFRPAHPLSGRPRD